MAGNVRETGLCRGGLGHGEAMGLIRDVTHWDGMRNGVGGCERLVGRDLDQCHARAGEEIGCHPARDGSLVGGEGCGGASTRGVCEGIGAVPEGPVLLEPQDVVEARGGLVWDAAGCGGKVAPSTCLGVSIDPGEVARASMMDGRLVLEPPSGWNRLIEVPLHPEGAVVDRRRLFLDECKQRSRRHLPQV